MAGSKIVKGSMVVKDKKFGIVVSRFNEFISSKLLEGAVDTLEKHGVKDSEITIVWVPGSFEIPMLAKKMAESGKYDAIICLGVIIRGETPHFDFVASEAAKGVAKVAMDSNMPCVFGILTTENLEQALDRAGVKNGNKGRETARSAIELIDLYSSI